MRDFDVGLRIYILRTQMKLTQEQLALMSGVSPAHLGLIERNTKNPTVQTLSKVCDALNISLEEFFHDPKQGQPDDLTIRLTHLLDNRSPREKACVLRLVSDYLSLLDDAGSAQD